MSDIRLDYAGGFPVFPNLWLGVTAENQEQADKRIPELLQIPAAVRFVSVEPMLGPVDLGLFGTVPGAWVGGRYLPMYDLLSWVIIGCETLSGGRLGRLGEFATERDWLDGAIGLVRQCKAAGVPAFVKQIPVDGRVSKNMNEWPEELRVREFPT